MVPALPEGKIMVLYGRRTRPGGPGYQIVSEGGRSPLPIIESAEMMDVGPQNIELDHRDVKVMYKGVDNKASVRVTAKVKIMDTEGGLHTAVENLLHVNHSDIGRIAKNFTEARLRMILRKMDIGEASSDLVRTASDIQARVQKDLYAIGITVENLTIHELRLRGG